MELGYGRPLFILAFDHRGSFRTDLFGIAGTPSSAERERIADAKRVIYEGLERAVADDVPSSAAGLLVDEEYGSDVARRARARGFTLAMPVEKSGQPEFDFEFGDAFVEHINRFDPTFAKVLVRYNPEGDRELNQRQSQRLRRLSDWLHESGRKFLFELLVTAEPSSTQQAVTLAATAEVRPGLLVLTIEELLQAGGRAPTSGRSRGLDWREDCQRVAEQARFGGRAGVSCIVLGRGADEAAVVRWLRQAAGVRGFVGFAIGRTRWWNELAEYVGDTLERDAAATRIGANYRRMMATYEQAESAHVGAAATDGR